MKLTPDEKHLARHALGLPNKNNRSYRNRFATPPDTEDWKIWSGLHERGLAHLNRGNFLDYFALTKEAALSATETGETLDDEDFY